MSKMIQVLLCYAVQGYFRIILINQRQERRGLTIQPVRDVPGTSPEGPLKDLTSGGPSGDSQGTNTKIDDLIKKSFFRSNIPCFTHLFLLFAGKTNFQKV